jgi:hypothetical protein
VNHRKCLEIFEKSKTVDPTDSRAVFAFETLKKEISVSEDLGKTMQKQTQDVYASVFSTNQSADEIKKNGGSNDPIAMALKKSNDEADKKE